jgi:hypothetical protein
MEAPRVMPTSTIPMNQFDMLAGAKASYEEFYKYMGTEPATPWDRLTLARQRQWVAILKAGIRAAKNTREAKQRRVT